MIGSGKGSSVPIFISAGAFFGLGLGLGIVLGTLWGRLFDLTRNRSPLGKRQKVRYGALQQ